MRKHFPNEQINNQNILKGNPEIQATVIMAVNSLETFSSHLYKVHKHILRTLPHYSPEGNVVDLGGSVGVVLLVPGLKSFT